MKLLFTCLLGLSFNTFAVDMAASPVKCEKGMTVYRYVDAATKNLVVACATGGNKRVNHGPAVIYSPKGEVIRETTFVEGRENYITTEAAPKVHEGPLENEPKKDALKKEESKKKSK